MKKFSAVIAGMLALLIIVSGVSPVFASAATAGTEISAVLNFSDVCVKKSTSPETDNLVISGAEIEVRSSDNKQSYGTYKIDDTYLPNDAGNTLTKQFKIKVPEWKQGSKYLIVFKNCPEYFDQYKQNTQTITYTDNEYTDDADATPVVVKHSVSGVNEPVSINLTTPKGLFIVETLDGKSNKAAGANVILTVNGTSATKVSDTSGLAKFIVPEQLNSFKLRISNTVNGYAYGEETAFQKDCGDGLVHFFLVRMEDSAASQGAAVKIDAKYGATGYNRDLMSVSDVSIGFYNRTNLISSILVNSNSSRISNGLSSGVAYTVKTDKADDYNVALGASTVTLNKGQTANINATLTPRLQLKVLRTSSGKAIPYKFTVSNVSSVSGKSYSGTSPIHFDVNGDRTYTVKDTSSGKEYSVFVDKKYSTVTLDLGTAEIIYDGKAGGNTSTNGIPKTGDVSNWVIISAVLVAGILLCGSLYVARRARSAKK